MICFKTLISCCHIMCYYFVLRQFFVFNFLEYTLRMIVKFAVHEGMQT